MDVTPYSPVLPLLPLPLVCLPTENSIPPWVRADCQTIAGSEFCAWMHPSWSMAVVTSASRLGKMASKLAHRAASQEWPPADRQPWPWHEAAVPGKGIGLVAARPIRAGERVMGRTPSLMVDGQVIDGLDMAAIAALLASAVDSLPPDHRAQFFNLSHHHDQADQLSEVYAIFATNAFRTSIDDGEPDLHSVFRDVSRLNHACQANCAYYFDPVTLTHNVHAVVDILPGEELTISYVDPVHSRDERRDLLRRSWGFSCTCDRCSAAPHLVAESDSRIRSIQALWHALDSYTTTVEDNEQAEQKKTMEDHVGPASAELLVLLYELEGLRGRLHEAYYRLALEWNGVGDGLRAIQAARRCLASALVLRGAHAEHAPFVRNMRALVADPAAHWSWRFRQRRR